MFFQCTIAVTIVTTAVRTEKALMLNFLYVVFVFEGPVPWLQGRVRGRVLGRVLGRVRGRVRGGITIPRSAPPGSWLCRGGSESGG